MHHISKKLYKLYKRHNPSVRKNFLKNKKKKENMLENKLKFPLRFFKNMNVVDVACGAGDYSLIYAQNGAKVKGYDFDENSIQIAKKIHKKFKIKNSSFEKKEFFQLKKNYDFVSCSGTLHHLPNPMKGLNFLTKKVKKNGFLFLGFGLQTSNVQHNLMKLIVRLWGNSEEIKFIAAKKIFSTHINRCIKYGSRSENAVIYDQFINDQHNYLDLKEVLKLLKKDFTMHSCWPSIFLLRGDSFYNDTISDESYDSFLFSSVYWSLKNYNDRKLIKKNMNKKFFESFRAFSSSINNKTNKNMYNLIRDKNLKIYFNSLNKKTPNLNCSLNEHYSKFIKDIKDLFNYLAKKPTINEMAIFIKNLEYLFKGTCGLGMNYFIFKKK